MRMSLDERMALRREMVFKAVRETMIAQGFLSTGYKLNVVRTDTRGHVYAVMIDIGMATEAGRALNTQEEMLRIETQIMDIAKTRYRVKVSNVFWRVAQPSPAPAPVAQPPRRMQQPPSSVDTDMMPGEFISAPSPMPAYRAVTPSPAPTRPAPVESDTSGLLLGNFLGSKPSNGRDAFPDTVIEEQTVRMERVTEDEMEAFARALAAGHTKDPVHVGSRTYQTDYAPLE
jgi:hypothetical protein